MGYIISNLLGPEGARLIHYVLNLIVERVDCKMWIFKVGCKYLKVNKGCIINVTSISSNGKRGTSIPYSVSKGALQTLTYSMAKALAPEVRVNAVSPGFTKTNMTSQRSKKHKQKMADQTLLKRIAEPEEIAEIIFILCASGSYITGETINVNGGHGYIY